jgi:ABC-type sugar transport system ATPase subunit
MAGSAAAPFFEAFGLEKSFGGQRALKGVDLAVREGEVLGLIGENGAGKSTLLSIVCGVLRPDAGELRLRGQPIDPQSYHEANALGIFRVFQDPALIDLSPAYENMFFGWEHLFRTPLRTLARKRMKQATREVLARAGVERVDVRTPVGKLSPGARQSLDIARVIGLADLLEIEHPLVLFDEPTTALDQEHEENFLRLIERLRERAAVVFVSHRLPEVLRTCGRIVVLKDGEKVAERPASGIGEGELHRLMVGRVRAENYYLERDRLELGASQVEVARLTVEGASVLPALVEASFAVAPGEILGVAGTDGSGKRELGEAIAGVRPLSAGQIAADGRVVRGGVAGAVAAGIGYVPADRQRNGLISGGSIVDNIQLASLHDRFATSAGGVWRRKAARQVARRFVDELGIVAASIDAPVSSLSGGNQQKVLLAKWLLRDPAVIVLDTPTQGVDTGARESIYEVVRRIARNGTSVVAISDDLPELIGLSNRIAVLTNGRLIRLVDTPADNPTEQDLVAWMIPGVEAVLTN